MKPICKGSKVDKTGFVERRHYERFEAKKGAFVALKGSARKLWQIIDISKGGVAFRYVVNGEEVEESSELDILTADTRFSLETLPFKCVSEFEMTNELSLSFRLRRCSVEFGKLTQFQVSKLERFIRERTVNIE
jgi:hypothetical protein